MTHDSTKGRVLGLLKNRSGGTAGDVAGALGITSTAARRHLADLETAGLVAARVSRPAGRGRPQHVYALTESGHEAFPRRYAELCGDILGHLEELYGSGAVLAVLSARNARLQSAWAPRVVGPTLEARLEALCTVLCECGYQASVRRGEDGFYYLEEGNCPALEVARRHPELCDAEEPLYTALLGAPVRRETRISQGAVVCRYRVGGLTG